MSRFSLAHLDKEALHQGALAIVSRGHTDTADLLAHLAAIETKRVYAAMGHYSMHAYCIFELGLEEAAAYRRIHVARAARRYPVIFEAIADGRLHLTAVLILSPYLRRENADELLAAASKKSKWEIEQLLAKRFPRTETLPMVTAIPLPRSTPSPPSAPLNSPTPFPRSTPSTPTSDASPTPNSLVDLEPVNLTRLAPEQAPVRHRVAPIAPQRFEIRVSVGQGTHDKLRRAQELLGPRIHSGDLGTVLDRALDALLSRLEKAKFAATTRPRAALPLESADPRHIPAAVKREVWERDEGRCTFVSTAGRRCESRSPEFDHRVPIARGGSSTVENLRLRCRTHNQLEAERTFGADFMARKREEARGSEDDRSRRGGET